MKIDDPDELSTDGIDRHERSSNFGEEASVGSSEAEPQSGLLEMREAALRHHEAGRLGQAQEIYREIIETDPNDADTLHLFGVTAHQSGNHALAIEYIERAIVINPVIALYYNNLGSAYRALKQLDSAGQCVARSLALKPDSAEAHYNLGVILSDRGERGEAELCFRQAILLQPNFTQAHFNLGILLRRIGRSADAVACFRQVLRIDPDNIVARFLSAAIEGHKIERAPDQYVAGVFDADAEKFDEHLVNSLHYDTPQRLLELCLAVPICLPGEKKDMLDLGCGTGLAGVAFAPYVRHLVGVDLSANMLARARARKLYQRLEHAELLSMMHGENSAGYDIVVAADVFIYSGRLNEIFVEVKRLLRAGGMFSFSVESLDALIAVEPNLHPQEYQLNASGRFAHSSVYIHTVASNCGFQMNAMLSAPARLENGKAVQAWLVLLQSEAGG
jgi:predicted TPR repeat methyltransferase